jgi:phosphoribosylglycinamide formyltransferase 1
MANIPRLAVLVSGSGTTLQNLIDRIDDSSLKAQIALVVGSKPNLGAEARALANELDYVTLERKSFIDVQSFSRKLFEIIDQANVDLVCMAGWLSLVQVPDKYRWKVLNIHPSLLPAFGGPRMYGKHVHEAVIQHGCKISGCTVHLVDDTYDNGPILVQRHVAIDEKETVDSLTKKVQLEEHIAYPQAITLVTTGRVKVEGRRAKVGR